MKRTERHHLKENELVQFVQNARLAIEANGRQAVMVLVAVGVLVIGVLGYIGWQSRAQARAGGLLAEAASVEGAYVGPPGEPGAPQPALRFDTERQRYEAALEKYGAAAEQYPGTDAGVFARYREAALHMTLGNPEEAIVSYQQVIDRGGDGIYVQMARLGLADAQVRTGQVEQAINTYKELSERANTTMPVDGILMQLGRAYLEAGQTSDAQQTFDRLVSEFPGSPYTVEAQRQLDELKQT